MPKQKKEWVEVKIWKTRKYPYRCTQIKFEMIDDGSQVDAVQTLMSYLNVGRYSFISKEKSA